MNTTAAAEYAENAAARIAFHNPAPAPDDRAAVEAHVNERPRYITELKGCTPGTPAYERVAGHAESRRHLATALGWTVPHNPGETTIPIVYVPLLKIGRGR